MLTFLLNSLVHSSEPKSLVMSLMILLPALLCLVSFFIRMPPFLNIQAESSKDLFEWKTSLEEALAQAPNAALLMGHNGIFRNDTTDVYEEAIPNCWFPYSLHYHHVTCSSSL
jgi:hypothetical protein